MIIRVNNGKKKWNMRGRIKDKWNRDSKNKGKKTLENRKNKREEN